MAELDALIETWARAVADAEPAWLIRSAPEGTWVWEYQVLLDGALDQVFECAPT
jgi:hypothetical protein